MILGREETLPEPPSLEEATSMPEAVAEHCAAIEVKGNFMFDPVRCSRASALGGDRRASQAVGEIDRGADRGTANGHFAKQRPQGHAPAVPCRPRHTCGCRARD